MYFLKAGENELKYSFEKGSKLFFLSLFTVCLGLLLFYVKFKQLNVNKWPK